MAHLNISDIGQLIKEVKTTYKEKIKEHNIDSDHQVFVANSGGKDSGATDLLAMEILEGNYQSVACDTGNEHPDTINHLKTLHEQRGGHPVRILMAQFSQEAFDARLSRMESAWKKKQIVRSGSYRGIIMPSLARTDTKFAEAWRVRAKSIGMGDFDCALDALKHAFKRTGNPFLDMCLLHGGFPIGRQRFCTDELKIALAYNEAYRPALDDGEVVVWSGVRGEESEKRAAYSRFSVDNQSATGDLFNFLPIHRWTAADVFALYKHFGIKPNPLYSKGMSRVGCMPCILVNKEELAEVAARFPEEIERVAKWEKQVAMTSRWLHWMIVGHVNRRQFKGMVNSIRFESNNDYGDGGAVATIQSKAKSFRLGYDVKLGSHALDVEAYHGSSMLGPRGKIIGGNVHDAVEWAKTGKGETTFDLAFKAANGDVCSSKYGLCE